MDQSFVTVAPHYPGGLVTADQLIVLAQAAARYGGRLRISGGTILIGSIRSSDRSTLLAELGVQERSLAAGCVRPVSLCAGKSLCPRGQQDSTGLGLALDEQLHGLPMPAKVALAVSGCPNGCSGVFIKDIGLFGLPDGYTLVIGGSAGRQARPGQPVACRIPPEKVGSVVATVLDFYAANANARERLGSFISRVGLEAITNASIPVEYRFTASTGK